MFSGLLEEDQAVDGRLMFAAPNTVREELSTWWQNPSQGSDVSCSWPPGLHTSQEGFCPTPLCRSSPSH